MLEIKFTANDTGNAIGRNGVSKCHGLRIYDCITRPFVELTPINSKGCITNCQIDIPRQDLPAIIQELIRIYDDDAREGVT